MPRTAARITQADVARAIRAAKQAGAGAVALQQDGTILILLKEPPLRATEPTPPVDEGPEVVL